MTYLLFLALSFLLLQLTLLIILVQEVARDEVPILVQYLFPAGKRKLQVRKQMFSILSVYLVRENFMLNPKSALTTG